MASPKRRVAILGSTGSIGTQALEVIAAHPERFEVVALAAGTNAGLLAEQVRETRARLVGIADAAAAGELDAALRAAGQTVEILTGDSAAVQIAAESGADVVLNGMTGSIGLQPTLAALNSGATLALANKESLVVGGALVAEAVQRPGQIVPVDSEHSALAQALSSGRHERGLCSLPASGAAGLSGASEVSRLVVTASGGPFRGWDPAALADVAPAQALKHPNYAMGRVVTTNSATMVNKALEVIEAHLLFDIGLEEIETVVHPQQWIHSMVQFCDGSTIAQAGQPRMLIPIALGLSWPERLTEVDAPIDWTQAMQWDFEPLDERAFPAVALAKQACAASDTHMAVYNAANEQAVEAFHDGRLSFPAIVSTVEATLERYTPSAGTLSLAEVLEAETWARREADALISAATVQAPA
ncbi:1-deoxy-D-xylulose-5-phosphate reductoisomerase [Nesterenkonia halotolerans]|uniref:1-deoxy-D-xylulose 5-phosphate reductoisomerase n=1 Tax=Nesterenkonia halotolerans TaxID=225325 RepID=A0ABR9J582_9MICC|nr:1-deoxy-D-xylulose-5-phosphate reductoisomerase [Nesterenkonia halotolerans]MBE1514157.1 1-deoxy-D-xylulose-5-phosphate reductoisomerase [Nesterenkonia halotolerans]